MPDLIVDLAAAPEGSRELSDACLLAFGWTKVREAYPSYFGSGKDVYEIDWHAPDGQIYGHIGRRSQFRPDPTRNLQDCKDVMVPKGWQWGVNTFGEDEVFNPGGAQAFVVRNSRTHEGYQSGEAKTDCNALCIAGIRAHEAMT